VHGGTGADEPQHDDEPPKADHAAAKGSKQGVYQRTYPRKSAKSANLRMGGRCSMALGTQRPQFAKLGPTGRRMQQKKQYCRAKESPCGPD
jgi:hypothetical protein